MAGDGGPRPGIQVTGPAPIAIWAVLGMFLGWSLRPLRIRMGDPVPDVSWLGVATLFFCAAIITALAWLTWRAIQTHGRRITSQQGVVRLVLGKTFCRVGAFGCGAYVGLAISWLGVSSGNGPLLRALAAAVAAAIAGGAGLALEYACRVPPDDEEELEQVTG